MEAPEPVSPRRRPFRFFQREPAVTPQAPSLEFMRPISTRNQGTPTKLTAEWFQSPNTGGKHLQASPVGPAEAVEGQIDERGGRTLSLQRQKSSSRSTASTSIHSAGSVGKADSDAEHEQVDSWPVLHLGASQPHASLAALVSSRGSAAAGRAGRTRSSARLVAAAAAAAAGAEPAVRGHSSIARAGSRTRAPASRKVGLPRGHQAASQAGQAARHSRRCLSAAFCSGGICPLFKNLSNSEAVLEQHSLQDLFEVLSGMGRVRSGRKELAAAFVGAQERERGPAVPGGGSGQDWCDDGVLPAKASCGMYYCPQLEQPVSKHQELELLGSAGLWLAADTPVALWLMKKDLINLGNVLRLAGSELPAALQYIGICDTADQLGCARGSQKWSDSIPLAFARKQEGRGHPNQNILRIGRALQVKGPGNEALIRTLVLLRHMDVGTTRRLREWLARQLEAPGATLGCQPVTPEQRRTLSCTRIQVARFLVVMGNGGRQTAVERCVFLDVSGDTATLCAGAAVAAEVPAQPCCLPLSELEKHTPGAWRVFKLRKWERKQA